MTDRNRQINSVIKINMEKELTETDTDCQANSLAQTNMGREVGYTQRQTKFQNVAVMLCKHLLIGSKDLTNLKRGKYLLQWYY